MNRPALDIRHLEMISVLLDTPRVTEAAEKLGVTPSALSHRLREVERRLEVPLFLRVHKRLRPTPAADYLAQVARRLLADMARAEDDVRKMASGLRYVVRLAVESYSAYHWLPSFLTHLRELEPDVGIEVVAAAARNPLASLHERTVDLIIVSGEINRTGIDLQLLFDDELRFIMPTGIGLRARTTSRAVISSVRTSLPIRASLNPTVNTHACSAPAIPTRTGSKPWKCPKRLSKWWPRGSVSRCWPGGRSKPRLTVGASSRQVLAGKAFVFPGMPLRAQVKAMKINVTCRLPSTSRNGASSTED